MMSSDHAARRKSPATLITLTLVALWTLAARTDRLSPTDAQTMRACR